MRRNSLGANLTVISTAIDTADGYIAICLDRSQTYIEQPLGKGAFIYRCR